MLVLCEYSGGDVYYNWLTDTFADNPSSVGGSVDSTAAASVAQSSLMFTVGRHSPSRPRVMKQRPVGPDFGKDRLGATDNVDGPGEFVRQFVGIF